MNVSGVGEILNGSYACPICTQDTPHLHDIVNGWIGVDLDGTLALQDHSGPYDIGSPVLVMVNRVQQWIRNGYNVRIFTSRLSPSTTNPRNPLLVQQAIEAWCLKNIGHILPITNIKDHGLLALWDDRAVRVIRDRGIPAAPM